jgi:adenylate cyclase
MVAEIERKYLVLNDDWRMSASEGSTFFQTYLMARKDRFTRIRIVDSERAFLAVKFRTSPLRREEFEYEIPYPDAVEMIGHVTDVLEKTRHEVMFRGYRWEIDVYGGARKGLVIAEVELKSETDAAPRPPWLGIEITGVDAYSNRAMARADRLNNSAAVQISLSLIS